MDLFRISCLIGIIGSLGLTLFFLMWRGKKNPSTIVFAGFTLGSAVWNIGAFMFSGFPEAAYNHAFFWMQIAYMGAIFAPAFFIHFVVRYLEINTRSLVRMVYGLAVIFAFFNFYDHSRFFLGDLRFVPGFQFYWLDALKYNDPIFYIFYISLYWITPIYCFFLLWNAFRNSENVAGNKIKYLMFAAGFGWLGTNPLWLPAFHVDIYPYANFLVALYPLPMAYVIVRHQVMDIEVIIKKTLVFAGLFAGTYAVFAFFAFLGQVFLERFVTSNRWIAMIPSIAVVTLMLRPLENFLTNATDKYLFQKKYDYKELLKTFTSEVLTVLDLDKLMDLTVSKLDDIIKVSSCAVLLFDNEKQKFGVRASQNVKDKSIAFLRNDEIVVFLENAHGYFLRSELIEKKIFIPEPVESAMGKLNAEFIIPMLLHEKMIGMLSLGKKKSDEGYTQDDLDILLPLAKTLAIAISNAELFKELGKTQAEAAQKEKMAVIGTLSAGINHEICNPLGIARGQCEAFLLNMKDGIYKDKTLQELVQKAEEIMAKVIKETDRATAITKKLSSFAKPAKGEAELVDINKEIDEVFGLVGYELRLEKIEFDKRIDKDLPRILVDRKQFQEVLFNLIRNAGQATGEKGRISIFGKEEDGKVVIDVQDTGSGIPENKIKELFNPFFTTKDPGKGTGLGLFIVRQVVEKNGGKICLKHTKVGEGTTFTVEFPAPSPQKEDRKAYEAADSRDRR